jgi:hypothetical protein
MPQHAARLHKRRLGVGHQHVPPAAKYAVDRRVRELQPLRVKDAALDVLPAPARPRGAPPPRPLPRRSPDDDAATRPHKRGGKANHARARCQLQDRLAGRRREPLEHPLRHRPCCLLGVGVAVAPSLCHRLPHGVARTFEISGFHSLRQPQRVAMRRSASALRGWRAVWQGTTVMCAISVLAQLGRRRDRRATPDGAGGLLVLVDRQPHHHPQRARAADPAGQAWPPGSRARTASLSVQVTASAPP